MNAHSFSQQSCRKNEIFSCFFSIEKSILMILPTAGMAIVQIESEIEHTMGIPPLKQNNSFVQERMIDY